MSENKSNSTRRLLSFKYWLLCNDINFLGENPFPKSVDRNHFGKIGDHYL